MATIKIEIVAGAQTHSITKTISGAHLMRLLDAQKELLFLEDTVTNAQVADAWFRSIFKQAKGEILEFERRVARDSADAGLGEIDIS